MRVITWNMGMGGVSRHRPLLHDQAWHYLLGLGPDLALVREALPPNWIRAEDSLVQGSFSRWGSAIFAPRLPLERFRLPESSTLAELGGYLTFATASLPDGSDLLTASIHAVDRKATRRLLRGLDAPTLARSGAGPRVNDVVFAGIVGLNPPRFIAAGDWNTGRSQGSAQGRKAGEAFFHRAAEIGWCDCVWEKHRDELRTWFREGDQLKQNDHVFCDQATGGALLDVWVATEAATVFALSDHAPLIVDFDIRPISMTDYKGMR